MDDSEWLVRKTQGYTLYAIIEIDDVQLKLVVFWCKTCLTPVCEIFDLRRVRMYNNSTRHNTTAAVSHEDLPTVI